MDGMSERINPQAVAAGVARMAEALRAAGWRVEPPAGLKAPRTGLVLPEGYRERVCQWARDNGLNPNDIPADADLRVEGGTITTDVFARGEDGKVVVSGHQVLRERITVPLVKPWTEA